MEDCDDQSDSVIRDILHYSRVIAVVGWSPKADRASNRVAVFLAALGWKVVPINPGHAGHDAGFGVVRASLREAIAEDGPVDMVDIFRRASEVGAVVDEAIALGVKVIWMQLGIIDVAASERARNAGLRVVMDRCPAIEVPRLGVFGPAGPDLV